MRKDWVETKLGSVANYLNGRAFKPKEWENEGFPIIRIQNLNNPNAKYNYSFKKFEDKYLVKKGDLLFAWSASLGAYIWKGNNAWLNQHIFKVECKPFIEKMYLYYFLENTIKILYSKAHGSGMVHVTKKVFEETKIELAPLPEQRAIVYKIEQLFSDLDAGIASLNKAAEQLKVYRQAVLKKAFEGELTKEWREKQTDLPSAEDLLKQIQADRERHYQEELEKWKLEVKAWEDGGKVGTKSRKPNVVNILPQVEESEIANLCNIPNTWGWDRAENVMKLVTNGTTPKDGRVSNEEGEVPFLKIHNLSLNGDFLLDYKTHYISKETSIDFLYRSRIFPNDVLLNTVGPPLGKVALVTNKYSEYNTNQNVTLYRTFKNYSPQFLKYYLISPITLSWIRDVATGTAGQSYMNLGHCRSIPLPILGIQEQTQIVQEIESRLSVCDKVEESIKISLERSEALRQSILKKAFEGRLLNEAELKACRAEADWEPAGVLLERIKGEKKGKG